VVRAKAKAARYTVPRMTDGYEAMITPVNSEHLVASGD
jgi:hypothetical protein